MALGVDSLVRLVADRDAFLAITETLMDIEHEIAAEIAARSSRGVDDFDVRAAANASFEVFRAAARSSVVYPCGPSMSQRVAMGMRRLRPLFAAIAHANH